MKLNNRGWGLTEMLVCCGILLFFLLIVILMIRQLFGSLENDFKDSLTDSITTVDIENKVEDASLKYMSEYYKQEIGSGTITITIENLKKNKYISENDLNLNQKGYICDGYALVSKNNLGELVSDAFIKCDDYETQGFQSWRLGA